MKKHLGISASLADSLSDELTYTLQREIEDSS